MPCSRPHVLSGSGLHRHTLQGCCEDKCTQACKYEKTVGTELSTDDASCHHHTPTLVA